MEHYAVEVIPKGIIHNSVIHSRCASPGRAATTGVSPGEQPRRVRIPGEHPQQVRILAEEHPQQVCIHDRCVSRETNLAVGIPS